MTVTEEQVRLALEQVIDPELFVNIVDLGLIYKVEITDAAAAPTSEINAPTGEAPASPTEATAPVAEPGSPSAGATSPSAVETTVPSSAPGDDSTPRFEEPAGVDVLIEMTMTSPACPAGPELLGRSKIVTSALPGVRNVDVKLVMTPPWSPDRMTEAARDQLGIF